MAERLATMLRVILLVLGIGCLSAKKFSIMAPNMFHIGVVEQVSIAVFDARSPVTVKLYLQDYPHRQKTFSQVHGRIVQGSNIFLPVKVEPEDLLDSSSVDKRYVYLVAKSDDAHFEFHKEAKILLSYKDGMVFIETDKPIYTPRQTVHFRVFPLQFDMKPSRKKITVVVQNPRGIKVQQWKDLDTSTGIIYKRLDLGHFSLMGNWTIIAVYGHQDKFNTSVQFEVKNYVLPKFSVKLNVPLYILKTDNFIKINITARYTYGKPVLGTAALHLSIVGRSGQVVLFARHNILLDSSGVTTLTESVQNIRKLPGNLWFPEKNKLQVVVDVIERATGNKESDVDMSCEFTSNPYLIDFRNTPKYFKSGLPFVVKVVVTYPDKQPARNLSMLLSAKGGLRRLHRHANARALTNDFGEAEFFVDACSNCHYIAIQVKTNDAGLQDLQNTVANYMMMPFNAESGPMMMIRQIRPGKVGQKIYCESFRRSSDNVAAKLSLAVVSRGRILSHNTTDWFYGVIKSWSFLATPQMSPSARLIGYYIDNNGRVAADSILLNVENTLPTKADFPDAYKVQVDESRVQFNQVEKLPGTHYNLQVKALQGTRLGLLCVDESVYLLRNENRLTKERIFKATEELDLGCGAGGGKDNKDIFKNAGVVFMTDNFKSDEREDYDCGEKDSRKKRSAENDFDGEICCDMGNNTGNVTWEELSVDITKNWSTARHDTKGTTRIRRSGREFGDLGNKDEQILDLTQVRSYFPETWIWVETLVGTSGLAQIDVTIPDTTTTWIMQAVAINSQTGLGLATPLRLVGYRTSFISLKMPYSIKRGEQVSLLATVFNYYHQEIRAKIYLKGNKDFCSIAADRKLALIGIVNLPPNDARSVAVPIVPKRIGEVEIEVFSILQIKIDGSYINSAGDAVKRKLLVVPDGEGHRKSQFFTLDPSGQRPNEQSQFHSIELMVPKEAIPGSVRAMIYLTEKLLGSVVNSKIEGGLEKLFRQPTGSGEGTMIYLARNVYVLQYLSKTNQLTSANEVKAHRFIQQGYARMLNYRRTDKSFSAFGSSRPGSTWLTAFVMRVLCKAKTFTGVNIDERLVCDSVDWLIQNQRSDGALPEINAVIHRQMAGAVYTEGDVAMTAFVLSTLAECKCKRMTFPAMLRATAYLEKQCSTLNRPYSMALTAYALSLLNSKEKFTANDRLLQNAVYDNATNSRHWNAGGNALNVETAGYALLTQIILGRTSYAGPIATYITNQRRSGIGFTSTQDTVVTLQALALYSEDTARRGLNLTVKLTSELNGHWTPEIRLTKENKLLRRQIDVQSSLSGKLFVETRGTGIGVLEVAIHYNLPLSRDKLCKFDLTTTVKEVRKQNSGDLFGPAQKGGSSRVQKKKAGKKKKGGKRNKPGCKGRQKNKRNCRDKGRKKTKKKKPQLKLVKSFQLKVCTRYREKGNTSMAIMGIGILAGFKPDLKSLQSKEGYYKETSDSSLPYQYLQRTLSEFDKVEVSDRSLVIYLSEIPSDRELCVDVQFDREDYVGVVQAVPVNVYDYYEPDESCSMFYGADKHTPLKLGVCDIGSSSCKCTYDECAQQDPPIGNIANLINKACTKYNYAIKGKVLLIDAQNSMLEYVVEVVQIIKRGNKKLKVGKFISLWKRGDCESPDLKENEEYLFMGLDSGDRYHLDKNSFVKLWPKTRDNNQDILKDFASQIDC